MNQELIKALAKLGLTHLSRESQQIALEIIRGQRKTLDDDWIDTVTDEATQRMTKAWGTDISLRHIDAMFLPKDNESVLNYVLETETQLRDEIKAIWKKIK